MSCNIHETAIVEDGAELGVEVEVGAYSIVRANVKIGDRSRIGPHVVVEGHTTIGEESEIFQFASVGAAPQDLKFRGEPSTLIMGKRNKVREFVTLQPGTETGTMTTIIGDENLFMANSHVGHDCRIGSGNIFSNSAGLAGHVTIEDRVILGGMVGIHQFCRIGSVAFLSAGSMIGHDVPPFCTAQGDRCHLRGLNLVGLERSGIPDEDVRAIKKTYRHLFSSVGGLKEKVEGLPEELRASRYVQQMLQFMAETERGIMSPARNLASA